MAMALLGDSDEWNLSYEFDAAVPVSGIYLCTGCGKELTARKGERFPIRTSTGTLTSRFPCTGAWCSRPPSIRPVNALARGRKAMGLARFLSVALRCRASH